MPRPGQPNNPTGINSFSGPLGEKEPAYGAVERSKVLTRSAPGVPSVEGAPKKAQRKATSGNASQPAHTPPGPTAEPMGVNGQFAFWQAVYDDPGASPLAREYAARALGAVS